MTSTTISEEEQEKVMEAARNTIANQGFQMKRALDSGKLMDALKFASNMICELRTGVLGPKMYYTLYMQVSDELRNLEEHLQEGKHGKSMQDLYELVQYAGNILPRLYLLITVGSVYIESKAAPAKDVLKDLVEMCRGVQHPTRGLFLRNYLSEMSKNKMPDKGNAYEGRGGNVMDSIDFILSNFTEMNKLWVRMQSQGPGRDREKRELERQELKLLVGKNLSRLSNLDGLDVNIYTETVFPKVVSQIIACKDKIAQQNLMEFLIQVFPDDFHLATLRSLLDTCGKLQAGVEIKSIISGLIDRLADYAQQQPDKIPTGVDIFAIFSAEIDNIVKEYANMPPHDVLALQNSLVNLGLKCYPERKQYLDQALGSAASYLSKLREADLKSQLETKPVVMQVTRLLTTPLAAYRDVMEVIELQNYDSLMSHLAYVHRKRMAYDIVKAVISTGTQLTTVDAVNRLFEICDPLLTDQEDQPTELDPDEFAEEQTAMASVVNLFANEVPEQLYLIYVAARKHFGQGGEKRLKFTLVPLVFKAIQLARQIGSRGQDEDSTKKGMKIFGFVHETITALSQVSGLAQLALNLFLQAAQAASTCKYETIAYEFISKAFTIYEEEIDDSRVQTQVLTLIIGTLHSLTCFSQENYDTLTTKAALKSAKLLKRPDQARSVCLCAHLFWSAEYRDGKRVLECLQKSLKLADGALDNAEKVQLFVEILNSYIWFFLKGNDAVNPKYLGSLRDLINTTMSAMDANAPSHAAISQYFQNTLQYGEAKSVPL